MPETFAAVVEGGGVQAVRIGSLWMVGKTDKGKRAYQVIAIERTPERRACLWDGYARQWVGVDWFREARRVTAQGNLQIARMPDEQR